MKPNRKWLNVIGVVLALPCAYFWLGLFLDGKVKVNIPFNMTAIVLSMLLSFVLSVYVAARWKRWVLVITGITITTFLYVGLRLH